MNGNGGKSTNKSSISKIYVGGLVDDIGNDVLQEIFGKFGPIRKVWVARHNGSKGYAFVDFIEREAAERAIVEMQGKSFMGAKLRVQFSKNELSASPACSKKTENNKAMNEIPLPQDTVKSTPLFDRPSDTQRTIAPENDMSSTIRTPALETLMHLERLARIRLEREMLEISRHKNASLESFCNSHEPESLESSLRSVFSTVVRDLLRDPAEMTPSVPVSPSSAQSMFENRNKNVYEESGIRSAMRSDRHFTEERRGPISRPFQRDDHVIAQSSPTTIYPHRPKTTAHGLFDENESHHTRNSGNIGGNNNTRFHPYKQFADDRDHKSSNHYPNGGFQETRTGNGRSQNAGESPSEHYQSRQSKNDWYGNRFYGFSFLSNGVPKRQHNFDNRDHQDLDKKTSTPLKYDMNKSALPF